MDKEDMVLFTRIAVSTWLVFVVTWLSVLVLCRVTKAMFPADPYKGASYQEIQSLKQCAAVKGTPVLEENGNAYKACAINGKSETINKVK